VTPVLEKPYINVSINPENIRFLHFTNGGHTRKSIMAAPMFLRIKSSIDGNRTSVLKVEVNTTIIRWRTIRVITKLPNSEQSYKGKVKTHKYINRQN
jgi:hypothetical protein